MPAPQDLTEPRGRRLRLGVIILIASLLLVGFGVQQGIYQHRADVRADHDTAQAKCIARYNADVEQVRDDRIVANQNLLDAQTAKDNAGDQVLLDVLDLIQTPLPDRDLTQLTTALTDFARKKGRLATVLHSTTTTLAANPYPTLDC